MEPAEVPQESSWAGLREAQTMALSLPKTGMAVIIDIGEAKDIHPKDKDDVGYRLIPRSTEGNLRQRRCLFRAHV